MNHYYGFTGEVLAKPLGSDCPEIDRCLGKGLACTKGTMQSSLCSSPSSVSLCVLAFEGPRTCGQVPTLGSRGERRRLRHSRRPPTGHQRGPERDCSCGSHQGNNIVLAFPLQ